MTGFQVFFSYYNFNLRLLVGMLWFVLPSAFVILVYPSTQTCIRSRGLGLCKVLWGFNARRLPPSSCSVHTIMCLSTAHGTEKSRSE